MLSLTVFLNLVAETLPQVSDAIPLLGSDAVWCVTNSGLLCDTWIVGGGYHKHIFIYLFQFDGLYTLVDVCYLFVSFERKLLSVCCVMIFVPFFGCFESVQCHFVCSRCNYLAVCNRIVPLGGPSVTPDF